MVNMNLERILKTSMFLFFAFFSIPLFGMQAAVGPQAPLAPTMHPMPNGDDVSVRGSEYSAPSNLHLRPPSDISVIASALTWHTASIPEHPGSYISAPEIQGPIYFGTETPVESIPESRNSTKSAAADWWGTHPPQEIPQASPQQKIPETSDDYHESASQVGAYGGKVFIPQEGLDYLKTVVAGLESAEAGVGEIEPGATAATAVLEDDASSSDTLSESCLITDGSEGSVDSDSSRSMVRNVVHSLTQRKGLSPIGQSQLRFSAMAHGPHTAFLPSPPKASATDRSGSTQASSQAAVSPTLYSQALTSEGSAIKSLQQDSPKIPGQDMAFVQAGPQYFNIAEQDSDAESEYKTATPQFGNEGSTETEEQVANLDEVTASEEQPESEASEAVGVAAAA